jgi:hypothetical protein
VQFLHISQIQCHVVYKIGTASTLKMEAAAFSYLPDICYRALPRPFLYIHLFQNKNITNYILPIPDIHIHHYENLKNHTHLCKWNSDNICMEIELEVLLQCKRISIYIKQQLHSNPPQFFSEVALQIISRYFGLFFHSVMA